MISRHFIRAAFVLLLAGVVIPAWSAAPWWNSNWHFRLSLGINAGGYERADKPVDVSVNFTAALSSIGRAGSVDDASIHVVEVDGGGAIIDTAVAFQFDRSATYNAASNAAGTLVVLMKGTTSGAAQRSFQVYFDLAGGSFVKQNVSAQVSYVDNVSFAGQASYQISTPTGTWYYHKFGGAFAGWKDKEGFEWLGYDGTPGSGASGEYRGMPNAVYNPPNPGFFHPGFTNTTSSVVSVGPLKMTINTKSTDGGNPWECQWEVYPSYATMTMVTQGISTYWFLFEGTPGGTYDPTTDYVVRSNGQKNFVSESWEGALPSPEFVYFGDSDMKRVAYAVHHEADSRVDSYRPLNDAMTVFGFGRDLVVGSYFNVVPQHFTVGFSEDSSFAGASRIIASAFRPIGGTLGQTEELALNAPLLVSPLNNATNLPATVTCRWQNVAGATGYRLQVGTDPSFAGSIILDDSTLVDSTRLVAGLSLNTTYSWRVRALKNGIAGPASASWQFSTGLSAPTLLSPLAGSTGQTVSLTLRWSAVSGAQTYRVQLGTDPAFAAGVVVDDSLIVDTTRSVGPLLGGTVYYWRAFARNVSGSGQPSAPFSFVTALGVPGLSFPADNASVPGTSTVVRWFRVSGATGYHLQVSTDASFASGMVVNDSLLVDTLRSVSGLNTGVRYYWRARAKTVSASSAFSGAWSFLPGLPSPALVSPVDKATSQPATITLVWRAVPGSTTYHLQLSSDSTFAGGFLKNDSSIVDTARTVAGLQYYTRYFWRVGSLVGATAGGFSAPWSFRSAAQLPGQVQLVSPSQGAVITSDSLVLRWNRPSPPANRYFFELSVDSLFSLKTVDSTLTDTTKIERRLLNNQRYWWRVKGGNIETWGPVSLSSSFMVMVTGAPTMAEFMPRAFALSQNYPNPFNPSTEIEFGVPQATHVQLKVYDILGSEVATLVDDVRAPGIHRVRFEASNLTSGVYLYRLVTSEGTLQNRMLLVK
jgi:hypothetical protein